MFLSTISFVDECPTYVAENSSNSFSVCSPVLRDAIRELSRGETQKGFRAIAYSSRPAVAWPVRQNVESLKHCQIVRHSFSPFAGALIFDRKRGRRVK